MNKRKENIMTKEEIRRALNAGELLVMSLQFGKTLSKESQDFCLAEVLKIIRKLQEEVG